MSNKYHTFGTILGVVGLFAVMVVGIYYKSAIWQECRATNSFWYCWHLVNAR